MGHSLIDDVPNELSQLRGDWGVTAGGWDEIAINRQIVNSLATVLTRSGIVVDVLPSTVPEGYKADLFLSVHANAHKNSAVRGFMVARSAWTEYPKRDDALVQTLLSRYGAATGMPDIQVMVTDNMTEYYAFNYKAYRHAISPETPAAIIEMGFMSNSDDLDVLTQHQTEVSWGIASAVMEFLSRQDR